MAQIIPMPDGFGGCIGDRYAMPAKPGAHVAYARGPDLVVEWYDFGDDAPYESANLLVFDPPAQRLLMRMLGDDRSQTTHAFASVLAAKFDSYFDIKRFADANDIPFATETAFAP